jgi:tryptophanyl-tRNA synthetase
VDGQKMSKSYNNTIEIFGDLKEAKANIMRIVTDSKSVADAKNPDECHVFALYKLFASDSESEAMAARYRAGGLGYGEVKKATFEKFEAHFTSLRKKREELQKNMDYVESILRKGAERARAEAVITLKKARQAVGL